MRHNLPKPMILEQLYFLTSEGWKESCSESLRVETWRVESEAVGPTRITRWARVWSSPSVRVEDRRALRKKFGAPPIVEAESCKVMPEASIELELLAAR